MTQKEKREAKLNKVLKAIQDDLQNTKRHPNPEWVKGWVNSLNMTSFLYGCARLNDMQVLTELIFACIACDIDKKEILTMLADKGDLHYEEGK